MYSQNKSTKKTAWVIARSQQFLTKVPLVVANNFNGFAVLKAWCNQNHDYVDSVGLSMEIMIIAMKLKLLIKP